MILGEVRSGFFQEGEFHLEFPRLTLELTKPGPLIHGQRRLLAGMVTLIGAHPVTKRALIETELFGHLSDRTRSLDHRLHGLFPVLGSEIPLRTRQNLSFPDGPILVGTLSGRFGAPHYDYLRTLGEPGDEVKTAIRPWLEKTYGLSYAQAAKARSLAMKKLKMRCLAERFNTRGAYVRILG
jgi:hypothetical protein